jgi:hypothetical protein
MGDIDQSQFETAYLDPDVFMTKEIVDISGQGPAWKSDQNLETSYQESIKFLHGKLQRVKN